MLFTIGWSQFEPKALRFLSALPIFTLSSKLVRARAILPILDLISSFE
jgi:hypothetical protein